MLKISWIAWIVGVALFLENLDSTIINTSIPQMAIALQVPPLNLKIGITSYLLTLAAFIPISGFMADKFGTQKIFLSATTVFLCGSALCGFAHTLPVLIIGRMIQGVGGAMMTPVGRLILIKSFSREEFVTAFSHYTLLGQIAPALGPVIGGAITTYIGWRLIFFVNLPLGLILFLLALRYIRNEKSDEKTIFDMLGFFIFSIGIGLVTFALTLLTEEIAYSKYPIIMLVVGSILLIIFYLHAQRIDNPSLDFKLFKINSFRTAVLGSLIVRIGIGGIPFLLPLMFQLNFGFNALISGLYTAPYGLAMLLAKPWVKKLLERFGFKKLLFINPLIISVSLLILACINKNFPLYFILSIVFIIGFFSSLQFTYMNILNFVDIQNANKSKATSMSSVFQQLAMNFGVCTMAGLLILTNKFNSVAYITLSAFHHTLVILAIITACSVLMFRELNRP